MDLEKNTSKVKGEKKDVIYIGKEIIFDSVCGEYGSIV